MLIKLLTQVILPVLAVTINYRIKPLMMLFIISWCKPLKPEKSGEKGLPLPNKHPDKLTYVCYFST